jgi:methyl-accepting chemotaxis protein
MVLEIGDSLRVFNLEIGAIKERIEHRKTMDKEINRQIHEVRQEIGEIHKQASDISKHIHDIRSQINASRQQISDTGQQISDTGQQVNDTRQQVNDTRQQVEAMVHQINGLIHHRMLFESDVMPRITGALEYQENLMKSLPVVLRRHERKLHELEN